MALWRVLDKTSAPLRGASSTRHDWTNTTKTRNRRKSKAAAKIGRRGKPLAHAPIFLRRRDPCFFITAHFLSAVLFAPSFFVSFTFRNLAATVCTVLLLFNTFCTVNYLSIPPQNFLLCGIIVYACKQGKRQIWKFDLIFQKPVYFRRFRGFIV